MTNSKKVERVIKKKEKKELSIAEKHYLERKHLDEEESNETNIVDVGSIVGAPSKLDDWIITNLIGEGTFSRVFIGKNGIWEKCYALKVERRLSKLDFMSNEITIMRCFSCPKELTHFPKPVAFARYRNSAFIAMTLLGKNLRELQLICRNQRFLRGTWSRVGIQALYAIKTLHEKGFIHRDIKPENLMMGADNDKKRWRIVHLIDFGLARQWAWTTDDDSGKYQARPLRRKAPFRGSINLASPNAHLNLELGRRDDLWSLLFTLVDLNERVPWYGIKDHQTLATMKTNSMVILEKMPRCFERLIDHLKGLTALQRPNYHMFFNILMEIMKESGQNPSSKYSFEENELTEKEIKGRKKEDWEDEKGTFFARDSVKINSPKDCIYDKNWLIPEMDHFELFKKKKKKRGGKKNILYNEMKNVNPEENYITRANLNLIRRMEERKIKKGLDLRVKDYEVRNELLEGNTHEERKILGRAQESPMKDIPIGEKSEENKEDEVNMALVVLTKEERIRHLKLNMIRKAREKARLEREKNKKE